MTAISRALFLTMWVLFVASFGLYGVDSSKGWECAWFCISLISDFLKEPEWGMLYYILFNVPNLLMLIAPVLFFYSKRGESLGWLCGTTLFSALYVLSFGVINWVKPGFELKSGYYLWLVSFLGLLFAVVLRRRELMRQVLLQPVPANAL